jgi:hypothetical protein
MPLAACVWIYVPRFDVTDGRCLATIRVGPRAHLHVSASRSVAPLADKYSGILAGAPLPHAARGVISALLGK